jgi:8-oxo-dGTP pyrophosphatase MutT (NUDIX family)
VSRPHDLQVLLRALAVRPARRLDLEAHARAAILVPVLAAPDGPALLFTVRAPHLTRHAGQIAFPGGRVEPGEDDLAAAVRETREEVGLVIPPTAVQGRLDDHPSPFGLIASPLVAWVPWPSPLRLQAGEVTETFVVPLATLRAATPTVEERVTPWGPRLLHGYDVMGRRIWGLTGNVVKDLLERWANVEALA